MQSHLLLFFVLISLRKGNPLWKAMWKQIYRSVALSTERTWQETWLSHFSKSRQHADANISSCLPIFRNNSTKCKCRSDLNKSYRWILYQDKLFSLCMENLDIHLSCGGARKHACSGGLTCVLRIKHLQCVHHGTGKYVCILLATKVEPVDLSGITPLVEGLCGLVVLQPLGNGTVYHHLQTSVNQKREETETRQETFMTSSLKDHNNKIKYLQLNNNMSNL